MTDEQTLRRVLREELERIERKKNGDHWVDGCSLCGAPTHGTLSTCPYVLLGIICDDGKSHRVEETFTPDQASWTRRDFKCVKCGNYGYYQRPAQRR